MQRVLPFARRALAGEVVQFENTVPRHGEYRHVDVTYVPHRAADGMVIGIFAFVLDVTEHWEAERKLRDSEARFRQLTENIQEVFWMSSADGDEVLYVSPAYERIWQRSVPSLYRAPMAWLEAICAEDRERVRTLHTPANLIAGRFDVEYRILRPDGSVRWIHDRGFPVHDETGAVRRIAGLAEDVTAIKQAADRERQLSAELAHMARLTTMGEMASGLAHELNQPLTAIVNYVDASLHLLRSKGQATAALRQAMEAAAAEAERAGQIIHRIRNFLHRAPPRPSCVDLTSLVREVLALAAGDIRESGTRLVMQLANGLPSVLADRIQIEQVVLNLVRNSLEAMQQTTASERVLTVRTARAGESAVQIAIQDTGCGYTAEAAAKLFAPFYTTKAEGMGMGLAISRTIITAHGGRLDAAPGQERGAVFSFTLPIEAKGSRP